ncbi:MAG: DUF975 family protein [Lachnospiraceae bacterium]|nr:DUF975 family protein [Lachnospiraceae bacterium]
MTRKEMKKNARAVVKKHYIMFLLTCIFLGFLGVEYTYSFSSTKTVKQESDTELGNRINQALGVQTQGEDSLSDTVDGAVNDAVDDAEAIIDSELARINGTVGYASGIVDVLRDNVADKTESTREEIFGTKRGVLAGVVNSVSQGRMWVKIFDALFTLIEKPGVTVFILLLISMAFTIFVWAFFKNMLRIISRRVFLEARIYEKVPYNRFLYFFAVKRWIRTAVNMMVWQIMETLWWFTVIGGPIKHYAYAMVHYICSENTDLKSTEAITLSRRMMKGHKMEMFKLDLSFLGWHILSGLTIGLSGIFYSNPYRAAAEVEFYAKIRKCARENGIQGVELLRDEYLFEKAAPELLQKEYADAMELYSQPKIQSTYLTGLKGLVAKYTSVVLSIDKDVRAVEGIRNEKNHLRHERDCAEGKTYPGRLSPVPRSQRRRWVNNINYNRYYSVWSVLMMFFLFCFIGWCWEVSLHIIQDGAFVNRGMLHGPWIPIYGAGGMLILVVLARLRKYPIAEFFAAILLSGTLEYMTSLLVELDKGKRWWDYTGYYMNLNGRICAEGLLVFGIMGMTIVYAVAPLMDHYLRRIPQRIIVPLSVVLMLFFGADSVYSHFVPNEGKGITDYEMNDVLQQTRENSGG